MTADIFAKPLSDKLKWSFLCKLGGLFEEGPVAGKLSDSLVAESIHHQSLRVVSVGTHPPGGLEDTLLPDVYPIRCRP